MSTTQPTGATFASTQQMAEEVRQAAQNRTPDPIQAAAIVCANNISPLPLNAYGKRVADIIATAIRELVAREQLKDILAVAAMREELGAMESENKGLRGQVALQVKELSAMRADLDEINEAIGSTEGHNAATPIRDLKADNTRLRERVAELEKLHDGMAESFRDSAQSMSRQLSAAKVELAAARRDAERLEVALHDSQVCLCLFEGSASGWRDAAGKRCYVTTDDTKMLRSLEYYDTHRAAIDAAMKEDGK